MPNAKINSSSTVGDGRSDVDWPGFRGRFDLDGRQLG
jgi:hypothetical protein